MNSKCLRPQIFETDVNAPDSAKKWKHWKKTFENYVFRIEGATARDKLDILVSLLDTSVYSYVSECEAYDDAVARLENAYVKPVNEIFARHWLNTCKQNPDESLEDFLERLKSLSNNCNFTDCTAAQIRETAIRDDLYLACNLALFDSEFLRTMFLHSRTFLTRLEGLMKLVKMLVYMT